MQRQARAGVVLPPSLLEKSLVVIADTVRPAPEESPLVTTFVERMDGAKELDAAVKEELRAKAVAAVRSVVVPAYQRMADALVALRPLAAGQAAGVGRLPEGADYYALALRQFTTTDDPPARIHEVGLAEVRRIDAEMDALLRGQGLSRGTVAERVKALQADPR